MTEEFEVDLDIGLRRGKPCVSCLGLVTDVFPGGETGGKETAGET